MDAPSQLVRFCVNNSPVSVSGTTSAAGLPYQIAFARPPQAPEHFSSDYAQQPVYDPSLSDLIDRGYYHNQPIDHHYNNSPLSNISTTLGDEDEDDDEEDESTEASSDQGITYFASSLSSNFAPNPAMPPTAIVDVRAADSSNLLDLDSNGNGGHGRLHRHGMQGFDGSIMKAIKHKKFKNPQLAVQQRRQANMRERRRMKSINHAFDGLRQKIPTLPYEKKLSKVDTLKLAINYIQFLQELIDSDDGRKNGGEEAGGENGAGQDGQGRPNGRGQRSQNRSTTANVPAAKKIIIECRTACPYLDGESGEVPPVRGHSLSWSRVGEPDSHSFMTARVWRPQQHLPQQPSEQAPHSNVADGGDKPNPSPASSTSNSLWYETDKFSMTTVSSL